VNPGDVHADDPGTLGRAAEFRNDLLDVVGHASTVATFARLGKPGRREFRSVRA
jgi:hypothetical protein